ncbi:MAG: hypothetical protein ABI378_14655 [Chitinophagaceae bacterium]
MRNLIHLLPLIFLVSCFKEDSTIYRAYLENATDYGIVVLPFKNGVVLSMDTLKLIPNQTLLIAEGSDRGIQNQGGFFSNYFSNNGDDSGLIIFDNTYIVSHYGNLPTTLARKYVLYNSTRNIFNYLSYDYTYKDINKHLREATYRYTFVDSDYQFAKQ